MAEWHLVAKEACLGVRDCRRFLRIQGAAVRDSSWLSLGLVKAHQDLFLVVSLDCSMPPDLEVLFPSAAEGSVLACPWTGRWCGAGCECLQLVCKLREAPCMGQSIVGSYRPQWGPHKG